MQNRFLNIYTMTEEEAIDLLDTPEHELAKDQVRYIAAAHLVNFDTDASRSCLIRAVKRADQDIDNRIARRKAVESLGRLKEKAAIPPIVDCLNDSDRYLVENCVWAIGEMEAGEPSILAKIADLLDKENQSYRVIIQTLRKLGYKEALPRIKEFTDHSDLAVASAALAAVAYLSQDFGDFDRVIDLLWHKNPMTRRLAIQDIVDAQFSAAIPDIASTPVSLVFRVRGIRLLAEAKGLPPEEFEIYLDQCLFDHPVTIRMIHHYDSLPPLDRLIRDLYDTDFGKCYLATLMILNHYRETAADALVNEIKGEAKEDYGAHYHIIKLLGWLGHRPSYKILVEAFNNFQPQFQKSRIAAAISLGELGDTKAIAYLAHYLDSSNWELSHAIKLGMKKLTKN